MNAEFPSQEADEDRPQCGYAIGRYRTELNFDDCECTESSDNLREEDCGSLRKLKHDGLVTSHLHRRQGKVVNVLVQVRSRNCSFFLSDLNHLEVGKSEGRKKKRNHGQFWSL